MTDEANSPTTQPRWQRRLLLMSPAIILLAAIILFNWLVFRSPLPTQDSPASLSTTATSGHGQAAAAPQDAPTAAAGRAEATEATPTAVALAIVMDPTPTPLPTLPPTAAITLLGPPADSRLPADSAVVLYWTWPLPLAETQQFVVYLRQGEQETAVGAIPEPNLGQSYRLSLAPGTLTAGEEDVTWRVQLEHVDTGAVLISSDSRRFFPLPTAE